MIARAHSATPEGIDARPIDITVDVSTGPPQMHVQGLSDSAERELCGRVRCALGRAGFTLPPRMVVVQLNPLDLPKYGCHCDLPVALALLSTLGHLPEDALTDRMICGELAVDGTVRPIRGSLAIAQLAQREGKRELIIPAANAAEAALGDVAVVPVRTLAEAALYLRNPASVPAIPQPRNTELPEKVPDLAGIRARPEAKRALEVAAAGGHHLLIIGPTGAGKTMLARRLPGILPPLIDEETLDLTKILSLVFETPLTGLVRTRPFRSPHPGVSAAGLIGGGSVPRPGEASLAHGGVLFLDELPEYHLDALEALRQPLSEGCATIVQRRSRISFPARFHLVAGMHPCPCGYFGNPERDCRCPPEMIVRYRARITEWLRDRLDVHVEMQPIRPSQEEPSGEGSADVARRVLRAREIQQERLGLDVGRPPVNAAMTPEEIERHCRLSPRVRRILTPGSDLTERTVARIRTVARTIADLAGEAEIGPGHVAEALRFRILERRLVL